MVMNHNHDIDFPMDRAACSFLQNSIPLVKTHALNKDGSVPLSLKMPQSLVYFFLRISTLAILSEHTLKILNS